MVAAIGVADAVWRYNQSDKAGGDEVCLVASIVVSVGGMAAPGARMPGRAFWDTHWQHFFERSAGQVATVGASETVGYACL